MNGFLDGGMVHEGDDCEADAAQQQHAHQHQQDHHLLLVSLRPPLRQLQLLNHRLELELSTNLREVTVPREGPFYGLLFVENAY